MFLFDQIAHKTLPPPGVAARPVHTGNPKRKDGKHGPFRPRRHHPRAFKMRVLPARAGELLSSVADAATTAVEPMQSGFKSALPSPDTYHYLPRQAEPSSPHVTKDDLPHYQHSSHVPALPRTTLVVAAGRTTTTSTTQTPTQSEDRRWIDSYKHQYPLYSRTLCDLERSRKAVGALETSPLARPGPPTNASFLSRTGRSPYLPVALRWRRLFP